MKQKIKDVLFYVWWVPMLIGYTVIIISLSALLLFAGFSYGKFLYENIKELFKLT